MFDHLPPPENQIPTLNIDGLQVFSALGRGSKGVVFLVRANSKRLALKVTLRESIEKKTRDHDQYSKRVSFEQGVLSRFDHPLFPRLHGVLATDKVVGYAIDYCPGRDLNSLRKKQSEGMFSDEIIRFYAAELVIALEYLHNQGIVYRDLKPENVMIQENGHLMLVDFDLSTNLPPKTPQPSPSEILPATKKKELFNFFPFTGFCNSGISPDDSVSKSDFSGEKSNSFVGTEEYVAPEVITGSGHDFSVDWWSLGVVLYKMLYGTTPFKGSNRKETFFKILNNPPCLVGETTSLRDLVRKLLEKDPSRRINVEGIKGHDFFTGLDWDLVLRVSRPPYIPAPDNYGDDGKYENSKIDVEKFVQEIFAKYEQSDIKTNDRINNNTSVDTGNFLVF